MDYYNCLENHNYVVCIIEPYKFPIIIPHLTKYGSYSYFISEFISSENFTYICNNINVIMRSKATNLKLTPHLILDDKEKYKDSIIYNKLTDDMKIFIDTFTPFILSK